MTRRSAKILKDSYDEAIRLLSDNKDAMDQIAAFLIDKETITGKEFMKIFRRVKGIPEPEEPKEDDDKGTASQELHVNPETQADRGERENQAEQANPAGAGKPRGTGQSAGAGESRGTGQSTDTV